MAPNGTHRSLVLRAAGTNCDAETVAALELAGSRADRLHVNQLLADPARLADYQLLVLPGGFTHGDDVASGAVLSYTLEKRLSRELAAFTDDGQRVLGICNGFQILVRLGLLPVPGGDTALVENHSGRFTPRWVRMRSGSTPGPWLAPDAEYLMPVAHAEGCFEWFPEDGAAPFPEAQVALRYLDNPAVAPYHGNPNGSHAGIAGIISPDGNVMGLMPHPERFTSPFHHPSWMTFRRADNSPPEESDLPVPLGLDVFRRAVSA